MGRGRELQEHITTYIYSKNIFLKKYTNSMGMYPTTDTSKWTVGQVLVNVPARLQRCPCMVNPLKKKRSNCDNHISIAYLDSSLKVDVCNALIEVVVCVLA